MYHLRGCPHNGLKPRNGFFTLKSCNCEALRKEKEKKKQEKREAALQRQVQFRNSLSNLELTAYCKEMLEEAAKAPKELKEQAEKLKITACSYLDDRLLILGINEISIRLISTNKKIQLIECSEEQPTTEPIEFSFSTEKEKKIKAVLVGGIGSLERDYIQCAKERGIKLTHIETYSEWREVAASIYFIVTDVTSHSLMEHAREFATLQGIEIVYLRASINSFKEKLRMLSR